MIRPHFDYGDYIIDSGTQGKIDKLERIQDRIVRTIGYKYIANKRMDIDVLKRKYNIEKLSTRRKRNLLKVMFNQSHIRENIDHYRPKYILRSNNKIKLKTKFTRITEIQRSPFYRGVNLWNTLPELLQLEHSKIALKNAINRYDFGSN